MRETRDESRETRVAWPKDGGMPARQQRAAGSEQGGHKLSFAKPFPHKTRWGRFGSLVGLLLAAVLAMLMLRTCSHDVAPTFGGDFVKSGGDTLDVAIEMTPGIYSVRGDSAYGRDYEILMDISRSEDIPVKIHPFVPLDYALSHLEGGDFDIVIASLPLTTDLKDRFLMTEPVYLDREVLVQRRDSVTGRGKIQSADMLGGDTVWIAADSPFETRIVNLSKEIGQSIHVCKSPEYNSEHLFILTALDQIPRAIVTESTARAMSADYPEVDISVDVSFTQFQTWALRKDNTTLATKINSALKNTTK